MPEMSGQSAGALPRRAHDGLRARRDWLILLLLLPVVEQLGLPISSCALAAELSVRTPPTRS